MSEQNIKQNYGRVKLWLLVIVLTFAFILYVQNNKGKPRLTREGQGAFELLLNAQIFSVGGGGFSGTPTATGVALNTLLKEEYAEHYLMRLIEEGTHEGNLYGLFGLIRIESSKFELQVRDSTGSQLDREVTIVQGCVIYSEKFDEVVSRIQIGEFQSDFSYLISRVEHDQEG